MLNSTAMLLPAIVGGGGGGGGGRMRDLRRDLVGLSGPRRQNVQQNQAMKNAAGERGGLVVAEAQWMLAGHDTGVGYRSPRLRGWTAAIVFAAAEPASPSLLQGHVATPVERYSPIVANPCWRSGECRRKNTVRVDSNT